MWILTMKFHEALQPADGAILVVDAAQGIEAADAGKCLYGTGS